MVLCLSLWGQWFRMWELLLQYMKLYKNKPLVERVVTITGKDVTNPCNVLSRIGIPLSTLIDHAGGLPETTGKVVSGGPMMGKAIGSIEIPVTRHLWSAYSSHS